MELHDGFNTLDYIVLAIILLSGLFAIITGFIREIYSLFNWIASYFIAVRFFSLAEPMVGKYISNPHTIINVSIFAVFCVSFITLAVIGMIITRLLIRGGTLTLIDRSFGFVFGIVRGFLIVCLVYLVAASMLWPDIDKAPEASGQQIDGSQTTIESKDKPDSKQENKLTMAAPHWLMNARTRPLIAQGVGFLKEFVPEKALEKTAEDILKQKEDSKVKNP